MNRSSIEWTDYTWNPVTGCNHGCTYCYARRLANGRLKGRFGYDNGFEPTFHMNRLGEPERVKKPSKIFTCSMGDLFGEWVPSRWISSVLIFIRKSPQHQFQILTKNPSRLARWSGFPNNVWLGTSVDGLGDSMKRIRVLRELPSKGNIKFVSFEPLLADVVSQPGFDLDGIDWIIVGAMTGPGAKPIDRGAMRNIGHEAVRKDIPIFIKDNVGLTSPLQEFPVSSQSKGEDESNG